MFWAWGCVPLFCTYCMWELSGNKVFFFAPILTRSSMLVIARFPYVSYRSPLRDYCVCYCACVPSTIRDLTITDGWVWKWFLGIAGARIIRILTCLLRTHNKHTRKGLIACSLFMKSLRIYTWFSGLKGTEQRSSLDYIAIMGIKCQLKYRVPHREQRAEHRA